MRVSVDDQQVFPSDSDKEELQKLLDEDLFHNPVSSTYVIHELHGVGESGEFHGM